MINKMEDFKELYTFENRKKESDRVLAKYPGRVPIVIRNYSDNMPAIDKRKFLVPGDLKVGQFMQVIRKRLKMNHEQAIFLSVNDVILNTSDLITTIYNEYCDDDGFLYITYSGENCFGG